MMGTKIYNLSFTFENALLQAQEKLAGQQRPPGCERIVINSCYLGVKPYQSLATQIDTLPFLPARELSA
jgi:hypothetical protein